MHRGTRHGGMRQTRRGVRTRRSDHLGDLHLAGLLGRSGDRQRPDRPADGQDLFPISKSLQSYFDIRQVKVRANVGYDVRITPSLSGIKNLEEEYAITVTATQTGRSKNYTLRAYNDVN